jgi:hypothetical protein
MLLDNRQPPDLTDRYHCFDAGLRERKKNEKTIWK